MMSREPDTTVGVFPTRSEAEQAVAELLRAGFDDGQIDMATTEGVRFTPKDDQEGEGRTIVTVRSEDRLAEAASILVETGASLEPRAAAAWENVRMDDEDQSLDPGGAGSILARDRELAGSQQAGLRDVGTFGDDDEDDLPPIEHTAGDDDEWSEGTRV